MPSDGESTTDFEDEVHDALIGGDDEDEEDVVPDEADKEEE